MASDGLCVVITGAASGLGAATAAILAKDGARIVINYSSSQKEAEATAELCRDAGATEVIVVQGDVSKDDETRMDAAKAAAPYVHAKLASVEHKGEDGGPLQIIVKRFSIAGD